MNRVHVGCGSVYLDGWINVDIISPNTFLAADRPDLVERWKTTDDQYYARHMDKNVQTLRAGPLNQEYVCDRYGDFLTLSAVVRDVDEVLARHCFEHLSIREARKALTELSSVMRPAGILRLDVPDHVGTLELFMKTQDYFFVRHLIGPRRNEFGFHMMSYTRDLLRTLVEEHGFSFIHEEPNIHFYPAFCLRFEKR